MAAFVARYARAFADVVTQEKLDTAALDRQLDDFLATWEAAPSCASCLSIRPLPHAQKVAVLDKMNAKLGLRKELRNLLAVLIKNDRIGEVSEVAAAWRAEMQERQGIRSVEIVTARELGEADAPRWWRESASWPAARVEASFKLDAAILGGTVVRIGSTVYDGSVRGRLDRLKEALVAG